MRDELDHRELSRIRKRVRRRLSAVRDVAAYVVVVGCLALLDWATGGGWWVQWVALVWGVILILQIVPLFGEMVWGGEVEERMVQREIERQRHRGP